MAECATKKSKRRRICTGDLDRKIPIYSRAIVAPDSYSEVQHDQSYQKIDDVWALVETSGSIQTIDGITISGVNAYTLYIRYDSRFARTDDLYVRINNDNIEVTSIENWDARNEYLVLTCMSLGDPIKRASL